MHCTAERHGSLFFHTYLRELEHITVVDIGSQDVNGSLRQYARRSWNYIGVDFVDAKGVDVVISSASELPFCDDYADATVSTSCFEHAEFFWLTFNEMVRITKPGGFIYINAPSNGDYHRYPVDCWRFYPDSGLALQNWATQQGFDCVLLESFIGAAQNDIWRDYVAVFVKGQEPAHECRERMMDQVQHFINGRLYNDDVIYRHDEAMDVDQLITVVEKLNSDNAHLRQELSVLVADRNTPGAKIGRQITRIGGGLTRWLRG